jgi:hypothetical protein
MNRYIVDIGVAGAFTQVFATGPTRAWRFRESILSNEAATLTPQGFKVKIPNDNTPAGFTTVFARPAASETDEPGEFPYFENWHHIEAHGPVGTAFGGAGNTEASGIGTTTATLLFEACSLTATATSIEVEEYF